MGGGEGGGDESLPTARKEKPLVGKMIFSPGMPGILNEILTKSHA